MIHRWLVGFLFLQSAALATVASAEDATLFPYFDVAKFQDLMEKGDLTSVGLVQFYVNRIAALDVGEVGLGAVIELNSDAGDIAAALDLERRENGPRGPLHGIPVVLKANIDTGDKMDTSAGSLALEGHRAPDDAFHVEALRQAGVVILGKANLSEWANFRSTRSTSGWSSIRGLTRNPYSLDRSACGSSSGSAVVVAAGLSVLAVGTETDGSVVCPASVNGVVGIKPTVGLVSRDGIIPIAHTQDTAGPMARTVRDAAHLLTVMARKDPTDSASGDHPGALDYASGLSVDALRGARIGIWRGYEGADESPRVTALFDRAIERIGALGATTVNQVALEVPDEAGEGEWQVLLYEFKTDLNKYLAAGSVDSSVDTLAKIIEFNRLHADLVMPWFGQEIFELAEAKGPLTDPAYKQALADSHHQVQSILDSVFAADDLDSIIAPTNGPSWTMDLVNGDRDSVSSSSPPAVSGYPAITLPMGEIQGLPIGLTLFGLPYTEKELISFAYAFEQDLGIRLQPTD